MPTKAAIQVETWNSPSQRVLGLEAGDGRCRVVAGAGEHVVPLQQLMEHDAVDEAAEADAEQHPTGVETAFLTFGRWVESILLGGCHDDVSYPRRSGLNI